MINGFLFGPLLGILIAVMMGYSVIKVFFASIKRGGILLIQIAIGSLYMFSVPRGFNDGFVMWVKQVIATCLTAFLQSTMLVCGLILFKDYWLLGLGIMLAAGEIPRIAGMFGLETSVRPNITALSIRRSRRYTSNRWLPPYRKSKGEAETLCTFIPTTSKPRRCCSCGG